MAHFTPLTSEIYLNLIERGYPYMLVLGHLPNKYLDLPEGAEGINIVVQPSKHEAITDKVDCLEIEGQAFTALFEDKTHSLWIGNGYVRKKKIDFTLATKSKIAASKAQVKRNLRK